MADTKGYIEASGVYFGEYEPLRFFRPAVYTDLLGLRDHDLHTATTASNWKGDYTLKQPFSRSAFRFMWYHWDKWDSYQHSGINPPSSILDWMRNEEPFHWYYHDTGPSGELTLRKLTKSLSYPFDDILTFNTGEEPIYADRKWLDLPYTSVFGTPQLHQSGLLYLPWYQTSKVIRAVQSGYQDMFNNPLITSGHPTFLTLQQEYGNDAFVATGIVYFSTDTFQHGINTKDRSALESDKAISISGLPIPGLDLFTFLKLNNLNLKPSGWINESNISGIFAVYSGVYPGSSGVLPGNGFRPLLDMAQQISYPMESVRAICGQTPINLTGIVYSLNDSGNVTYTIDSGVIWTRKINVPSIDGLFFYIPFGLIKDKDFNITISGSELRRQSAQMTITDWVGVTKQAEYTFIPKISVNLDRYSESQAYNPIDFTNPPISPGFFNRQIELPSDIVFAKSGTQVVVKVTSGNPPLTVEATGTLARTVNDFGRYYDGTTNYLADSQAPFDNASKINVNYNLYGTVYWQYSISGSRTTHVGMSDSHALTIPDLRIPENAIKFNIDGINVPVTPFTGTFLNYQGRPLTDQEKADRIIDPPISIPKDIFWQVDYYKFSCDYNNQYWKPSGGTVFDGAATWVAAALELHNHGETAVALIPTSQTLSIGTTGVFKADGEWQITSGLSSSIGSGTWGNVTGTFVHDISGGITASPYIAWRNVVPVIEVGTRKQGNVFLSSPFSPPDATGRYIEISNIQSEWRVRGGSPLATGYFTANWPDTIIGIVPSGHGISDRVLVTGTVALNFPSVVGSWWN